MKKNLIALLINPEFPNIYGITYKSITILFNDSRTVTGYFQSTNASDELSKNNIYTFIEEKNIFEYRNTFDMKYVTEVCIGKIRQVI